MRLAERIAAVAAVVAVALVSETHRAGAQAPTLDGPQVGARVRISRIAATPVTGTLLARGSDSIVVGHPDGRRESVALKDVTGLELSGGRRRNVTVGVALGLVAGAVGGVELKKHGDRVTTRTVAFRSTDPNNLYLQAALGDASVTAADTSVGNSMWIPFGMIAGTATGTVVGLFWKERWRPAAIRRGDAGLRLVPEESGRRVALALSARF